jgi:hypothetical protein
MKRKLAVIALILTFLGLGWKAGETQTVRPLNRLYEGPSTPVRVVELSEGQQKIVSGANPLPGQPLHIEVPAGKAWAIQELFVTLTTSSVLQTRIPIVGYDDASTLWTETPLSLSANGANETIKIVLRPAAPLTYRVGSAPNWRILGPFTDDLLFDGYKIRLSVVGGQSGDDWGAAVLNVVEYVSTPLP